MRLTLRTLLAYMDDILDPADKEELAKKIESSGFAEDLIYRTQDTMRRLRLSAPQVMGTGMALDPNTVSEYLDNVLPPDSVGDFERICLESDVHLAEVASSHHVLTMVLGEPADVDSAMRERMHSIPLELEERKRLRIESAHRALGSAVGKPTAAAAGGSPTTATTVPSRTPTVELPEYLRTSMWQRHRVALTAVAALLLVAVTAVLAVRLDDLFRGGQSSVAETTTAETTAPPSGNPELRSTEPSVADEGATSDALAAPEQPGVPVDQADGARANGAPLASETALPAPSMGGGEVAAAGATTAPAASDVVLPPPTGPSVVTIADDGAAPGGDTTALSAPVRPPDAVLSMGPANGAGAGPAVGALPETGGLGLASSALPDDISLPPGDGETAGDASLDEGVTAGPSDEAVDQTRESVTDLGTYLGGTAVLLRYSDQAGAWFRLAARSAVANGDRLLALPAFRPKITLTSGVHVDLSGGTQIVVRTAEAAEANSLPGANTSTPALEVVYGRIVLVNTANEDNQVVLKLGPTIAAARLARGATLAVEVERTYVPGRDPRTSPAPLVARLYVPKGEVVWRVGDGETTIGEPARWTIADGVVSAISADATPPEWIDEEPVEQRSEQLGAQVIAESLDVQRPVDNQLLEQFQTARRREVKSLAARSSIHVGLFVPFVEALRDSDQRPNWKTHIESLRAAMALSPESATKVWQTLVEQRGEKAAADLYEMLCGYDRDQIGRTPEEMDTGALARLIGWLEDDNLDYRVLAVHDLREITGKNLLSNPAGSLSERVPGVRRWRERLKAGELMPLEDGQRETQ
jgi:hypothetical protein